MEEELKQIIKELREYDIKSLRKILEAEKESLIREARIGRESAGLIIASSFTISVLLLSFITQRTLILDLSIVFLFISIFSMLELYFVMASTESTLGILEEQLSDSQIRLLKKMMTKKSIIIMLATRSGIIFFYLGILYLATYFNIFLFAIPAILYLWINFTYSQYNEIKEGWEFSSEHWKKAKKWHKDWKERKEKQKKNEKSEELKEDTMIGTAYNYQIRLRKAGYIIGITLKVMFFSLTVPLFLSIIYSL